MAILIRDILAEITDLTFELVSKLIPNRIIVNANLKQQLFFVTNDNLVQHQASIVPFSVTIDTPFLINETYLQVDTIIEHISHRLINNGSQIEEQIIIQVTVIPEKEEFFNQHVHIRNVETLQESISSEESFKEESLKTLEPEIQIIPNLSQFIEEQAQKIFQERMQKLEQKFRIMIEESLRFEIEDSIREEFAERERNHNYYEQLKTNKRYAQIREKSIYQRIHGYKTSQDV
ncbi:MAG: hypothetical protein KAX49_19505 [Halanaerobiales bacterium]|nr:hypothetical protein [Halanaerobiales bacterium]